MKRATFDETRDQKALPAPTPSTNCPAYGCPNAASTSFDHGGHWACFRHANAPSDTWPAVTREIREGWPGTANWNHADKLAHEAEESSKRIAARAKSPGRYTGNMASIIGDVA